MGDEEIQELQDEVFADPDNMEKQEELAQAILEDEDL